MTTCLCVDTEAILKCGVQSPGQTIPWGRVCMVCVPGWREVVDPNGTVVKTALGCLARWMRERQW